MDHAIASIGECIELTESARQSIISLTRFPLGLGNSGAVYQQALGERANADYSPDVIRAVDPIAATQICRG